MAKLSIFLLGLTIVLSNTVSCNEVELEYKDLLEEALSSYHASIRQETYPPSDKESSEDSKNNLNDTKFVCTGGLDPSTITRTEYVKEFAKGPCSPAVVIPGIGASKLIVEVDRAIHDSRDAQIADAMKAEFLNTKVYAVIRFRNEEVLSNLSDVLNVIKKALEETQTKIT